MTFRSALTNLAGLTVSGVSHNYDIDAAPDDLSRAHIAVFPKLTTPATGLFFNLGTGTPTSVREVISACERVTGKSIPLVEKPRRPGDPPRLIASSEKIQRELGWKPKFPDIESIVATAWKWHSAHPRGYADR